MIRIVRDPAVRGGSPVIRGTRVTVADILAEIARGAAVPQLRRVFPFLEAEDIEAAIEYAARSTEPCNGLKLSIVVIVYAMQIQAQRTLRSLGADYQIGVSADEYEVVVVENASAGMLGESAALAANGRVRYFAREDGTKSPVGAANFGVEQARAPYVALVIDGARMLSPGVISTTLGALRAADDPAVAVPGYHLGREVQQQAVECGYDEAVEARLLSSVAWPLDGYRLFDISCLSGSCRAGVLSPFAESNFFSVSKDLFQRLGGFDSAFDLPGGGFCNLDLYKRVCEHPNVTLFVTPGEGTFHQFHGGVTTGGARRDDRERYMAESRAQYAAIRGAPFRMPAREATLFGRVPKNARPFMQPSSGLPKAPRPSPGPPPQDSMRKADDGGTPI